MNNSFSLSTLDANIKRLLTLFIIVLSIGVAIGLIYLSTTAGTKFSGIEEHYKGSPVKDEFDIPAKYPKTINNLLLTTHNHLLSLSMIFLCIGFIFSMSTFMNGKLKWFLIYEPFISILLTFGGIWGIRFINSNFLWIVSISGTLMYICYFIMTIICLWELNQTNPNK